jgi:hypothetical protein
VQHERIGVGAELGNDEGDLVRHQCEHMLSAGTPIADVAGLSFSGFDPRSSLRSWIGCLGTCISLAASNLEPLAAPHPGCDLLRFSEHDDLTNGESVFQVK